jgi:hypothetical protein
VGIPENNSTLTAAAGVRGSLERGFSYGLGLDFASSRSYAVRAGLPPAILTARIPVRTRLEASLHVRIIERPIWAWVRLQSTFPQGLVDSPFPNAGALGSSLMVGLEYRPER